MFDVCTGSEPEVGSSHARSSEVLDEVDGPNTIRVRPMSRQVTHRRSNIHSGRYGNGSDTSSSSSGSDSDGKEL